VYSWDALEELCIKPKNWKDLLTEEPFSRKDIIHLQVRRYDSITFAKITRVHPPP
jgi:hypothetical protein